MLQNIRRISRHFRTIMSDYRTNIFVYIKQINIVRTVLQISYVLKLEKNVQDCLTKKISQQEILYFFFLLNTFEVRLILEYFHTSDFALETLGFSLKNRFGRVTINTTFFPGLNNVKKFMSHSQTFISRQLLAQYDRLFLRTVLKYNVL